MNQCDNFLNIIPLLLNFVILHTVLSIFLLKKKNKKVVTGGIPSNSGPIIFCYWFPLAFSRTTAPNMIVSPLFIPVINSNISVSGSTMLLDTCTLWNHAVRIFSILTRMLFRWFKCFSCDSLEVVTTILRATVTLLCNRTGALHPPCDG